MRFQISSNRCVCSAFAALLLFSGAPVVYAQPATSVATVPLASRAVLMRAVAAVGGEAKVKAINNITAYGYGQQVYQFGGGRIDGNPMAPEKVIAANDLVRVYDLENERFQMRERRNNLFPFLLPRGHSWAEVNQILDGELPYNLEDGAAVRQPVVAGATSQWTDEVHSRRMWAMNNPIVLLRRMMDPATRLSPPHVEDGKTRIDLVLAEGDSLSAYFDEDGMPWAMRWSVPNANLGQANLTTYWSGWAAWDGQGGVLMPLGFDTRLDWRDVDFFKMFVDAYEVNTDVSQLAAPTSVANAPEPVESPLNLSVANIAEGLWRISNGTTVVEFKDHLVLFELGIHPAAAKRVLEVARDLAPGKPIRYLVPSHNHSDHTAGIRQAVAEGITIIQRESTLQQLREAAENPAPAYPDDLATNPQPFRSLEMGEHLRLQDETRTLDLYWGRNNGHFADVVFGYVPEAKVMMEGDLVSAAYDWSHWPDTFRDVVDYYELDVDIVSPAHTVRQISPDVLTVEQVEDLVSGGVTRARQHCSTELAKGNYHPGCPIRSKYY